MAGVGFIIGVLAIGYLGTNPVKPAQTITWIWREPYYQYGYAACSVEMFYTAFHAVQEPNGYSDQIIDEIEIENKDNQVEELPDIILILNESYYDLGLVADITTDVDYMEQYRSLDNAIKGYCVVPGIGGGTNCSEYELLTSNSLQLMPGITPFNYLDIKGASSIVSVLKELGYYTIGSHSQPAVNYNRGKGYTDLGFDRTFFQGDFVDLEFYYGRGRELDESVYGNLQRWHEETIKENDLPTLMYNLTFQNHGSYNMLPEEGYIVHIQEDYGEYTASINEFLTGIHQSNVAIQNMIDYYSEWERPVIVCMVGDHCPDFAPNIVRQDMSESERNLKLRSVPFLIWSNQAIEKEDAGYISMNMLVPRILKTAGLPTSPYYQYMCDLSQKVPVTTAYNTYYDCDGNEFSYDVDNENKNLVQQYFYMEYNNLKLSHRREELFETRGE